MKKIINGKMYNTETAKCLSEWCNGHYGDLTYVEETLYRKRTGEYFLYGLSGAADKIADAIELLYQSQGEDVLVNTGYYDPEEDKRNNEEDQYTDWWYVNIN